MSSTLRDPPQSHDPLSAALGLCGSGPLYWLVDGYFPFVRERGASTIV